MSRLHTITECLERKNALPPDDPEFLKKIVELMGIDTRSGGALVETLPFSGSDATAGAETELQAAVIGRRSDVDLPIMIEQSNYYANIMRRTAAGDTPRKVITDLEKWLTSNQENVWENSWVRFPRAVLSSFAEDVFRKDLLADKQSRNAVLRSDAHKFVVSVEGEDYLRVPLSYLLKLALADVVSASADVPRPIHRVGCELMEHFSVTIHLRRRIPFGWSFPARAETRGRELPEKLRYDSFLRNFSSCMPTGSFAWPGTDRRP